MHGMTIGNIRHMDSWNYHRMAFFFRIVPLDIFVVPQDCFELFLQNMQSHHKQLNQLIQALLAKSIDQ